MPKFCVDVELITRGRYEFEAESMEDAEAQAQGLVMLDESDLQSPEYDMEVDSPYEAKEVAAKPGVA